MNRILFKRFLIFLTVILTVAVMTFAFTACSFGATDGGKDNTSDVTDDDKDNTGEVTDDGNGDVDAGGNEGGNEEGGADGDETTPEEPENPEEPVEPVDPEEPEPEPEPTPEPEPDPEDEPQDITEVDEIDEINKFGDKAIKILKDNYLDGIAENIIGTDTAKYITKTEWYITNSNNNKVKEFQIKTYYTLGDSQYFKICRLTFDNFYSIQEILNNEAKVLSYKIAYTPKDSMSISTIEANKELGNLVINKVNGTNTETQNEGDIWCSIGSLWAESGKEYRTIKVYQINENQVQKYELIVEATTVNVNEIMQNIKDGKTKGTPTCETMYTFTGIVIE